MTPLQNQIMQFLATRKITPWRELLAHTWNDATLNEMHDALDELHQTGYVRFTQELCVIKESASFLEREARPV